MLTPADVQRALDAKTKPPGSLGRLEALARQIALAQGTLAPDPDPMAVLVFAGDHGVAAEGVSPYPQEVTAQMLATYAAGGAAVNVLARSAGVTVRVVDVGVAGAVRHDGPVVARRVRAGTGNIVREPAMTSSECATAIGVGREALAALAREGYRTVALGEMGIGNSTVAAALVAALTGWPPEATVGRGTGLDDAGLLHKAAVVARALERDGGPFDDPLRVLASLGGLEVAALVGALLEAPRHGLVVVLDGYIVSAAALAALRLDPSLAPFLVAGHRSAERAHGRLLEALGLEPLLDLGLRLGEGTGAVLALPVLRAACAVLREMATFASAGVSERVPSSRPVSPGPASALSDSVPAT